MRCVAAMCRSLLRFCQHDALKRCGMFMTVLVGGCIVLFVRETFVCAACFCCVSFLFANDNLLCCCVFLESFQCKHLFYFHLFFYVDFVFPKYFKIHFPGKPFSGHCPGLAGIGNLKVPYGIGTTPGLLCLGQQHICCRT